MGLLDRLFGTVKTTQTGKQKPTVSQGKPAPGARPAGARPAAAARPQEKKPAPAVKRPESPAARPAVKPAEKAPVPAEEKKPLTGQAAPAQETAPEASALPTRFPEGVQKRLDTYFARLRQEYPDGQIRRLNTGHKKLAERGAELRRLIGYDGKLDEFFALGGFTYCRSAGGRPSLPAESTGSVEDRLRAMFPEDVPTVLAVKQADPRLYLDLRAAARKQGCTAGEYLQQFKAEA